MNFLMAMVAIAMGLPAQDAAGAEGKPLNEASVTLRFSELRGDFENDVDWEDLLGTGVGMRAEFARLWPVGDGLRLGGFVSLGLDLYSGDEVTSGGATFEPESVMSTRFALGALFRQPIGPVFFVEERLSIGAVFWPDTEVDVSTSGPSGEVDGIERSTELFWAAEFRAGARLGEFLLLGLGVSYERLGAPDVSSDLGDISPDDPGALGLSVFVTFSW